MHVSDQRVMKIRELKVNCLAIFNILDNNLSFVLFLELVFILVKSDGRQFWQMRIEAHWKLKIKAHKNNLFLFYYK